MRALFAVVLLGASGSALADTLFVDPRLAESSCSTYSPTARACGAGADRAFQRLDGAHSAAAPGDVVVLRDGLHVSPIYGQFVHSGTADAPIAYRGMDGERAIVSCETDVRNSNGGLGGAFRLFGAAHVTIENLELRQCYDGVVLATNAAHPEPPHHVLIRNVVVHDCIYGLRVLDGAHDVVITDVLAYDNGQFAASGGGAGLRIGAGRDIRVERMTVRNSDDGRGGDGEADGFHVEPPPGTRAERITFIDCVARDNGEDGFDLTADETRIERCTAEDNYNGFKLWDDHGFDHPEVYRYLAFNLVAVGNHDAGLVAANGPHIELYNSVFALSFEGARFMRWGTNMEFYEAAAPTAVVVNNLFIGNSAFGRRFQETDLDSVGWNMRSDHNLFFGNGDDDERWPQEGASSRLIDPLFVDLVMHDLHLTAASPARGAGEDLSARFTTDREGRERTSWDIGPYAYVEPLVDAGGADASVGTDSDAGASEPAPAGCGCAGSADPSQTMAFLGLLGLAQRHRRRRRAASDSRRPSAR